MSLYHCIGDIISVTLLLLSATLYHIGMPTLLTVFSDREKEKRPPRVVWEGVSKIA